MREDSMVMSDDISNEFSQRRLDEMDLSIARIDRCIIALLAARFAVTHDVGILKAENSLPSVDPAREAEKLQHVAELAKASGGDPKATALFFRLLMDEVVVRHNVKLNE
ncbi:chorismate mutase [Neorhizobium galegae]|uniref:chorismate mutase n=1 Tax=Neorhizobium galegae TaxID=399 RepID=UPI002786EAD7|nr:chorismate mutase [Neorhizobium galegae]MDQ0137670.1 chorismate mutase [Neorhizobium galegae]